MDQFKPLIDFSELDKILEKDKLSMEDKFKLDSVTPYTLVESIDDLKNEELNEVYHLEARNIYRVINSVSLYTGVFGKDLYLQMLNLPESQNIRRAIISEFSSKELQEEYLFFMIIRHFLSIDSNGKSNNQYKPVFEGKIPKKIFSFRQASAEEWFVNYTDRVLKVASKIYVKMGAEDARAYVFSNAAWYLNKSQTFRYHHKSTDRNMNETLARILEEFFSLMGGGDISSINKNHLAPLYKDL